MASMFKLNRQSIAAKAVAQQTRLLTTKAMMPVTVSGPLPPPPPLHSLPPPPGAKPRIDWSERVVAQAARSNRPPGVVEEETARILSLPYLPVGVPRCPDQEAYGLSLLAPATPDKAFRIRPVQVDAIWSYETYGGELGAISVGFGKTLVAIACAVKAIRARGHYRACIMVPPEVYGQFAFKMLPEYRLTLDLQGVPFYCVHGPAVKRMAEASRPGPGVWIYSYSSLSAQTGYDELLKVSATAYILDEAHCLSRSTTARTKRWHTILRNVSSGKTLQEHSTFTGRPHPGIEVVALSGTLTKKSIADYAHLSAVALKSMSPAPAKEAAIKIFTSCLDAASTGTILTESEASSLRVFHQWADSVGYDCTAPLRNDEETDEEYAERSRIPLNLQERTRFAYMHRLQCTPGVVSTSESGVGSSLLIGWQEPVRPKTEGVGPASAAGEAMMVSLMQKIVKEGKTPNDDVIDFAMHQFKWLWELSSGFYNSLEWPSLDHVQEHYQRQYKKGISREEAEGLLAQAQKHHQLLQEYHKTLRHFLDREHIPHCDTPHTVALEISRQLDKNEEKIKLPRLLIEQYKAQRAEGRQVYPDLPERISRPVRVCDYKITAASAWAKERIEAKEGGIIWYYHPVVGNWMHEYFTDQGIPHTYAPAGENDKAFATGLVIASYAHGTGKNLQHQNKNLFVELLREAAKVEQTLGRTHRSGQKADEVLIELLIGSMFDLVLFNSVLSDADYIQSTLGQRQRLCYASYPKIIPPTNPRLAQKLGIIREAVQGISGNQWERVTPAEISDVADVFRPVSYRHTLPPPPGSKPPIDRINPVP